MKDEKLPLGGYLRLMRLPNVFTAMADVAMGFLFVQSPWWNWNGWRDGWTLGLLVAASSLLYAAGMTLNDVFDVEIDRCRRPERPIPSGQVSLGAARRLGWGLLFIGAAIGVGVAYFAGQPRTAAVAVVLAAVIVLYDALLKRTPLGPVAMGGCRMLNVLLGMSVSAAPWAGENWLVAGSIGVYVVGITWFARTEAEQSRRTPLVLATLVIALSIALLAWLPAWSIRMEPEPGRWRLLVGALGALIVWRCVRAVADPTPLMVRMAVVNCLLSLVMLDAAACYAVRGIPWACAIMALLLPTLVFQRKIAMT